MFFRKKEATLDRMQIINNLLAMLLNDAEMSRPVYLDQIKSESDGELLGIAPIVYIWNENRAMHSFSVSVNGNAISHLLEALVPRNHSMFNSIRDEIMAALATVSNATVVSTCEKMQAYPSDLWREMAVD